MYLLFIFQLHLLITSFSHFRRRKFNLTMVPPVPSLLEYARYHGAAIDHLTVDLDPSAYFDIPGDLADSDSTIASLDSLPKESKLQLNKPELRLLTTSIRPQSPPSWDKI